MVTGELKPKSKFLGNSAATIMEGEDRIRLLSRPGDGDYVITVGPTSSSTHTHQSLLLLLSLGSCGGMGWLMPVLWTDAKHICKRDTIR